MQFHCLPTLKQPQFSPKMLLWGTGKTKEKQEGRVRELLQEKLPLLCMQILLKDSDLYFSILHTRFVKVSAGAATPSHGEIYISAPNRAFQWSGEFLPMKCNLVSLQEQHLRCVCVGRGGIWCCSRRREARISPSASGNPPPMEMIGWVQAKVSTVSYLIQGTLKSPYYKQKVAAPFTKNIRFLRNPWYEIYFKQWTCIWHLIGNHTAADW